MRSCTILSQLFLRDCQFVKVVEVWKHFSSVKSCYDILGLSPSCTTVEIKEAYIKLCKQFHPDAKPGDRAQHRKFVELNNAYSTLINAQTRKAYDYNSGRRVSRQNYSSQSQYETYHNPFHTDQSREERFWHRRHSHGNFSEGSTSAYDSTKRKPKMWIVVGCFTLMIIGTVLYYSAYSFATNYTYKRIDTKSQRIGAAYLKVKEEAQENGKEKQLQKFYQRWGLETNISEDK